MGEEVTCYPPANGVPSLRMQMRRRDLASVKALPKLRWALSGIPAKLWTSNGKVGWMACEKPGPDCQGPRYHEGFQGLRT